ncbi:CMD domain protein [Clavibacter michiganensis]|uniref:CMD domain protein n=1 Tax=Clavibacter michiganensis TaxID=28447 RepID=UPI001D0B8260|nr:CMD domain protein [Clavibacter michiganensis]MDO4043221.1 CMD domain protein [Clavibacter michiganensis]MDO4052733.1 CMD domain protein [Clavibacter michiganensis]MDO4055224.1 CMD domain protein [Clavibacter michiganensis]MDO4069391.1 CMD domain protein [Clavibacter michiganensis]UDM12788.1 CMD domain protein [Clavibacter michiganensis subsp. michiganensis]
MTHAADVVDLLAGLAPDHPLRLIRDLRPDARANAQRSFEALLEPAEPGAFTYAERYAVAAFVARLHGSDRAAAFYADLLGDADAALVPVIDRAARQGATAGPTGTYREPGLAAESVATDPWTPDAATRCAVGPRLAAALAHAHLLVIRPRESSPDALRALGAAGWTPDEIVSLSQLIAFLAFQLRVAWGLAVLAAQPVTAHADPARTASTPDPAGAAR